jgi:mannosyltransferase
MKALRGARNLATPLLLVAITLLGGAVRVFEIGQKGLWLDEAFSVWLGWRPLPEMWGWIARIDQHPPLYYTLLNIWMRIGDDAATVRLLSALFSTLTIPVIFLLGRRLAGRPAGLLAALVLAVAPFHVHFAQETRMYALLTLLAAAAMMCLAYLLTENSHVLSWIGYVVFTAAAMLTHSTALLLPLAANLFVFALMWRRRRWGPEERTDLTPPPLRWWLLAQAGVVLLWGVIWLPSFIAQATGIYREFWLPAPTWRTVVDMLGNFLSAHLPRQRLPWTDGIWVVYLALLAFGATVLRRRPWTLGLLLTLFLTPVLGALVVSLRRPVFSDRTLIWASIPLYVLLATGIAGLRKPLYILSVAAILVAASAISLNEYYTNYAKEGWREAAAYVSQEARSGDLILFNASWTQIPFDYYYRHAAIRLEEHGLPVDLFERGVLEPKMAPADLARLRELINGRERVWLVYSHNLYTDPQNLIPTALSQALQPVEVRSFEGLEITLYEGADAR